MDNVFTPLGASNHSREDREVNDFYATDPKAAKLLLEVEPDLSSIWECACGEGHLAEVFKKAGKLSKATDLIDRGYGNATNFLLYNSNTFYDGDIVTNPPFKDAVAFIQKALDIIPIGNKVCMFLKLLFLEGQKKKQFFKQYPPKIVYVCSGRVNCAKNGDFKKYNHSAIAYAWYVWVKGYNGETIIKWIN